MKRAWMLLLVMGCSEFDITGEQPPAKATNPPEFPEAIQEDRIVQRSQPVVDVLFIVDNSCSMDAEQIALAENFPVFASWFELSGLDFHIGVTSTDVTSSEAGLLRQVGEHRFIDADTVGAGSVFTQMAVMGIEGDTDERGRHAAFETIEVNRDHARNLDFYRDEASLHMVFVSDEEDSSGQNPVSQIEFRNWMDNLKTSPDLVTAHAITWIPGQSCPEGWSIGDDYVGYAEYTGGAMLNICETDWEPFMFSLGLQTSGLKREFFLTRLPVIDSIAVQNITLNEAGAEVVRGFQVCTADEAPTGEPQLACDAEYNPVRNSITFLDFVPDPLSSVVIRYQIRELANEIQEDNL